MKRIIITLAVAVVLQGASQVYGSDTVLFSVQTQQGQMISVASVTDHSDASLQIGRYRVLVRNVSDITFTQTPDHRINAQGDMYLVGPANIQTYDGETYSGKLRIQTNRLPETPAYANITTKDGETLRLSRVSIRQPHNLIIEGKRVSLVDIQSIEYLEEPDFRITSNGDIFSLQDARIVTRNGKEHTVTLRGVDYWYGHGADGLVVVPVEHIQAISFTEHVAMQ